jgi:RND family efflux transporter MFP subunit
MNLFQKKAFFRQIVLTSTRLEAFANRTIFEPIGLTTSCTKIIALFEKYKKLTPGLIIKEIGGSKSNITQRLNLLEKQGIIKRQFEDLKDKRNVIIIMTKKGENMLNNTLKYVLKHAVDFEKHFTKEEKVICYSVFNKINKLIDMHEKNYMTKKGKLKNTSFNKFIILLLAGSLLLSGCGANQAITQKETPLKDVKVQSAEASKTITEEIEYPAMVLAQEEAKIVAKVSGTITDTKYKVGDKVNIGDLLFKIDDPDENSSSADYSFNTGQVKQAKLATEQALTSLQIARTNYNNLLISSNKDITQLEIAKNQANVGAGNLNLTTDESYKSAELAYETSKIAAEQARLTLEDRKKIANQSANDTETNANTIADSAAITCSTVINSINNLASFNTDNTPSVPYQKNLGVLDTSSYDKAKSSYEKAKNLYSSYRLIIFPSTKNKVEETLILAEQTKKLVDDMKYLFDQSISSNVLPVTSLTGVSMSSLQTAASGYQSTIYATITQLNGINQGLKNVDLNNDALLNSLEKSLELARQQEASAKQNLANLKAGAKSQKDQAGFGVESANTQYESTKAKINSQIAVAKSQVDLAELQYKNAFTALESLYDAHLIITPISGTITNNYANKGNTISAGQLLATVSKVESIKIQLYMDQTNLPLISLGQPVKIKNSDGQIYPGKISAITPQADPVTKRFLVEIIPNSNSKNFILGTIVNVLIPITKKVINKTSIILPLSAIDIGNNGNSIFILGQNNIVAKKSVNIIKIEGESAELEASIDPGTLIIIEGNKLINEGEKVNIIK